MADSSAAQQGIGSRRRPVQTCLCLAMALLAMRRCHADNVVHEPGKIAVDPTSNEDSSVELNQRSQLGSSTNTPSAYPTLNGEKVTSANLNHQTTPTTSSGGSSLSGSASGNAGLVSSSSAAETSASTSTSTAAGVNSGSDQLIRSAGSNPLVGTTSGSLGGSSSARGAVSGISGGSGGGLVGYLSGQGSSGSSGQANTVAESGNSAWSATSSSGTSSGAGGHVTAVSGGRKMKL